ncbi:probable serine/threonine-protein kinase PBL13 at C-terminar half [Coccomyxa sp. Obi]|nr:probable serine/threonine-protein kinase PBL13 at C-terminar half [Coccomyxa sp. Obi]
MQGSCILELRGPIRALTAQACLYLVVVLCAAWLGTAEGQGMLWKRNLLQNAAVPAVRGSGSINARDFMDAYNRNMSAYDMIHPDMSNTSVTFTFDPIGDIQGMDNFVSRAYDYVVTDIALNATQIQACNRSVMQIPFAVVAISAVYNLPGIGMNELRLDADTLAGFFQCNITAWDDLAIKALNPHLRLPAAEITVMAMGERASSTWILSSFLDEAADAWVMGASTSFAWGPCVRRFKGELDMLRFLNTTHYSFGVAEHGLAAMQSAPHAWLENLAGYYVLPSEANWTQTIQDVSFPDTTLSPDWIDVVLGNSSHPFAYPLAGLEYFIVNQNSRYMGYPASMRLQYMAFNLLTHQVQGLLRSYRLAKVPPQLLALSDEAPMMLVNRAPNDTDLRSPGGAIAQLQPSEALSSAPTNTGQDRRAVIIGCAVGGAAVAALAAAALALFIGRRRRRLRGAELAKTGKDSSSNGLRQQYGSGTGVGRAGSKSMHASASSLARSMGPGSGSGTGSEFKSTMDGSCLQFERTATGELCLLGQGKFGKVYKARYLQKLVAVKVLTDDSPEQQAAFLAEALMLRELRHPHIVQYLGHIQLDGKMLLILEFMQGGNLAAAIAADNEGGGQRRLAWGRHGLGIATSIALGLHYLHSKRIIWFDCKCQNVLLDRTGMVAKLSDVGISKAMNNTHTQAFMKGTPGYIAPELVPQLCGSSCAEEEQEVPFGAATYAVDIYSFGIVLWEIITGESPQAANGRLRVPRVPEECSAEARQLYQRCISRKPADRPDIATVLQILHDEIKSAPG